MYVLITGLSLLIAAAAGNGSADPLTPAKQGMIQCLDPDEAARTCDSMVSYRRNGDGTYTSTLRLAFNDAPLSTIETDTIVRVSNGVVCGQLRPEDFAKSRVHVAGEAVPADETAEFLRSFESVMAQAMNEENCTRYTRAGALLFSRTFLGGNPSPLSDQHVIWIQGDQGYTPRAEGNETSAIVQVHDLGDGPGLAKEMSPPLFANYDRAFHAGVLRSMQRRNPAIEDKDLTTSTEIVFLKGHKVARSVATVPNFFVSYQYAGVVDGRGIMIMCMSTTDFDSSQGLCGRRLTQIFGASR